MFKLNFIIKILIGTIILMVGLFICPKQSYGEEVRTHFDLFTQEQGLSNNAIRCVLQDSKGFLWVGTEYGLNRYDGHNFKNYVYPNSLPAKAVLSMYEDRSGTLWLGTPDSGLLRYNADKDVFSVVSICNFKIPNGNFSWINNIYQDKQGILWFATIGGLIRLDPITNQCTLHLQEMLDITDVIEDLNGNFWLNCWGELRLFDRKTGQIKDTISVSSTLPNPMTGGKNLVLLPDGNLITINNCGVYIVNPLAKKVVLQYTELDNINITSLCLVNGSIVWLGTHQNGLIKLDLSTNLLTYYKNDPKSPDSLIGNHISALCQDSSGVLWIGDKSYGLNKLSLYKNLFSIYQNNPFIENTISNNYIRGICEDKEGFIWISTQFGGLNKLDRQTGQITRYQHNPKNPNSLASDTVWNVYEDSKGFLWVGAQPRGLQLFDRKNNKFLTTNLFAGLDNNINRDILVVNVIYEDKLGQMWLGSNNHLYLMSKDNKSVINFTNKYATSWNIGTDIQAIFEDSLGTIWVGTENGFLRFNPSDNTIVSYKEQLNAGIYVTSFLEDKNKNIWIATKGAGILCLNLVTNKFTSITEIDGLPHNNTYGILEDAKKTFWISTDNGVTHYNPKTKIFESFGVSDGLQGKEFNRRAFFKSRTGEFFFGGPNGLNSFYPEKVTKNATPPPIIITEFLATGNYLALPNNSEKSIELNYTEKSIQINFAAIDFNASENNIYKYRLVGFDKNWVQVRGKNTVTYTNLSPGKYTFEVTGTNNHQVWQPNITRLKIDIWPPPWRTPLAYLVYLLILGSSIFLTLKYQTNKLKAKTNIQEAHLRAEAAEAQAQIAEAQAQAANFETKAIETQKQALENENLQRIESETKIKQKNLELEEANLKLKELDEVKAKFAAMLVHDLKSPLTVVNLTLEMLLAKTFDPDPDLVNMVTSSEESIKKIVTLVNEMLEFYQSDSQEMRFHFQIIDLFEALNYATEIAKIAASKKNISIKLTVKDSLPLISADTSKLERVFSNLLSNAIKFTPEGGQISLVAWTEEGTGVETGLHLINVSITDTGEGILAEEIPFIFDPYRQAKSSSKKAGVGLGLAIVKRILAAHSGSINVHSQLGIGT
ncbi:MAG: Signal transduction histidine kinase, partial [bacterium]